MPKKDFCQSQNRISQETTRLTRQTNMAPPETKEPPSQPQMRFQASEGSEIGTCPRCLKKGLINDYCLPCYKAIDVDIGSCDFCNTRGPVGEECSECDGYFEEDVIYGVCKGCHGEGICGCVCTVCEDQSMIFE